VASISALADVAVGCALGYLDFRFPQIDWRTDYPNLVRLHDKLMQRPSFADTDASLTAPSLRGKQFPAAAKDIGPHRRSRWSVGQQPFRVSPRDAGATNAAPFTLLQDRASQLARQGLQLPLYGHHQDQDPVQVPRMRCHQLPAGD